jgi:hypothetical protein
MDHSLNDISTQIINAVYAGLKKPANYSLSFEQVKDEFAQERNRYIENKVATGVFDAESFRQTIPKLPVAKKDFANVTGHTTNRSEYYAEIPEVMHFTGLKSIGYVAAMNKIIPFKICFGNDIFYVLKDKRTGDKPTIWIQDKNLWLLNPPIPNIQHITMRAIFENPRALNGVAGIKFVDDDPYPIPGSVSAIIRDKMVDAYIKQYRMANVYPTLVASDINLNKQ